MSHIAKVEVEVKDVPSLKKAVEKLGLVFNEGKTRYKKHSITLGDLPVGFTKEDINHCEHSISVKGNSSAYEVGVAKRRDGKPGFLLLYDNYEGGYGLEKIIGNGAKTLTQRYSAEVAMKQLRRQGFRYTQKVDNEGNIQITAKR